MGGRFVGVLSAFIEVCPVHDGFSYAVEDFAAMLVENLDVHLDTRATA